MRPAPPRSRHLGGGPAGGAGAHAPAAAPARADPGAVARRAPRVRDAAHAAPPRRRAAAAVLRLAARRGHGRRPHAARAREPRRRAHLLLLGYTLLLDARQSWCEGNTS